MRAIGKLGYTNFKGDRLGRYRLVIHSAATEMQRNYKYGTAMQCYAAAVCNCKHVEIFGDVLHCTPRMTHRHVFGIEPYSGTKYTAHIECDGERLSESELRLASIRFFAAKVRNKKKSRESLARLDRDLAKISSGIRRNAR